MKKFLSKLIIFMLVISSSTMIINNVKGENITKSKKYELKKDIILKGVYGSNKFFFQVDNSWKVKDAYLNLIFTQSEIINKNYSSITVLINGFPIYSTKLENKQNVKENIKISIPTNKVINGYNEIEIKSYRRISEKPCVDDLNNANWLALLKESYVHINFEEKEDTNSLREFPFPYIKASDEKPVNSVILLPDKFESSESTAAMMLAANFGSKRKFNNLNIQMYKISDYKSKNNNIIFISKKNKVPKEILNLLNSYELKSLEKNCIIKEVKSPYNKDKKMLIIISNNDKNIIKAAALLSSKNLVSEISSSNMIVGENLDVYDKEKYQGDKIVLSKLGYDNVTLKGMFRHEVDFNISIPKNRYIKDDAKVVIKSRYSKNLDFDRSLMTVYINDTPIGSRKLESKYADEHVIEIKIPEEIRNTNNYNVKIAFDLEMKDLYCTIRQEDTPWAYISNESYIYTPYDNSKEIVFENYPNPFVSNGVFNNLTMVLPDNPSSRELTWAANIIAHIGHDVELNTGKINVIKNSEISSKTNKDNLIVFGTPNNNDLIKKLNNNLYIKFDDNFNHFLSNEKINLLKDYSKKISSLQLIDSPYSNTNKIMVVTAVEEKDLSMVERYLKDFSFISRLKGNGVIIDRYGDIMYNYYGKDYEDGKVSESNFFKKISLSGETKFLVIFLVFLISFSIIVIVLLARKHKRNV
ncbi:cellulose biosynthesis cyclic di-GMP-binding regulatory protein BcsB [Haloimpatiens sp. FM7330]|uniref:cellulose biosynthesis cyclic di-GMP-binding regulatory protein BcsB n=1 Tax=Haloimpatiens sp. FM7330 TaxID=3298610 RepID=UPI003637395A